jgi:hypothetical protein
MEKRVEDTCLWIWGHILLQFPRAIGVTLSSVDLMTRSGNMRCNITLSVGSDATHPLMSSITVSIDPKRRGQIMGLAKVANLVGMGLGALLFRSLMVPHSTTALECFGCAEFGAGVLALYAFRTEAPASRWSKKHKIDRGTDALVDSGSIDR